MFLKVLGSIPIPPGTLGAVYEISRQYWPDGKAPVTLSKKEDGLHLEVGENSLQATEDDHFKRFLRDIAHAIPTIKGTLVVWWPMVIEAGPQEWILSDGKLLIAESTLVWDPPYPYGG